MYVDWRLKFILSVIWSLVALDGIKNEQSKINHLINPGMQNLSHDNSWSFEGGKGATPSWSLWRQVALIKLKNSLLWCNKLYSSLFKIWCIGSFREIKSDNDHKKRKLFGSRAVVVLLSWSCIFRIRTTCDAAISNDNLS